MSQPQSPPPPSQKETAEESKSSPTKEPEEEKQDPQDKPAEAPPKKETVNILKWFEYLVGVPEPEFRENLAKYIHMDQFGPQPLTTNPVCPCDGMNITIGDLGSDECKRISNAGTFFFPTIADLFAAASKRVSNPVSKKCTLYVDTNTTGKHGGDVDICALQANPDNANSMFQVASNLNTIESIDELTSPDSSNTYVSDYINDHTQGPFASVSAGPGSIMRVYGMYYDKKTPPNEWMQTKGRSISMVGDLKDYYTVCNGYIMNNGSELSLSESKIDELVNRVRIGIQQDVDVVFGKRVGFSMEVNSPRHRVSQVFCAAMNLSQGDSGRRNASLKYCREKTVLMLRASYIGAYLSAVVLKCNKLFLTFVGGGAFGNSFEMIVNELIYAHKLIALGPLNNTVTEVHLSIFSQGSVFANNLFAKLTENGVKFVSNEGLVKPFTPEALPPRPIQPPSYIPDGVQKSLYNLKHSFFKVIKK